jgi:uncharacterized protein (DUF305 family)
MTVRSLLIQYPPTVYKAVPNLLAERLEAMRLIAMVPVAAVALAVGVLVGTTIGQEQPAVHDMMGMQGSAAARGGAGPATQAFQTAMDEMMKAMMVPYTGDVDVDFARGMIAHHEGAIAMAEVELEHGKDARLRKLAEEIITAQDVEITFLKGWLAKKAK